MTDRFATARKRMVQEQLLHRGIDDQNILTAMSEVPRHLFVCDAMQAQAYGDYPLPIDGDQTISQPYIVAAMTQALKIKGTEKVLEIGTGSGYQAAILSRICDKVYTVERINTLLAGARKIFDQLRYHNILAKLDDGTLGWPEHAPYDAIIVTASGPEIPEPLIEQLADPGRMVIPVGDRDVQQLQLLTKKDGDITIRHLESVRFVSLIGEHGWNG
ncbi:MAG TPA: protein-L-isoaspartate(D-aspartate) O-methyltransferase [Desulfobacterales bacterium]|nr:protein-L-isoaspartate(D-aspartate) O-methyltransferase [Desulfobacterales bacterium]HIP40551.1 protein-L-isoaspartate(D-aspartate) O-methyltransferase [Desulfocapsa sulfexigens]